MKIIDVKCDGCGASMDLPENLSGTFVEMFSDGVRFRFYENDESFKPISVKCEYCKNTFVLWHPGKKTLKAKTSLTVKSVHIGGDATNVNIVISD